MVSKLMVKKYWQFGYGLGALDKDPIKTGAEYAQKHGWYTQKVISGGADSIHSTSYQAQIKIHCIVWVERRTKNVHSPPIDETSR